MNRIRMFFRHLRINVLYIWRIYQGTCTLCGGDRGPKLPDDVYAQHPTQCRWCTKTNLFGQLYDMSGRKVHQIISVDSKPPRVWKYPCQ